MTFKTQILGCFLLLFLFFSYACNTNEAGQNNSPANNEALYEVVPSSKSGITFTNTIIENDEFNYYTYMHLYSGAGVASGDINNDGLTDLYFSSTMGENKLYLNKGDMKFEDISVSAGVNDKVGFRTGVSMADVNGDGLLDIYVSKSGWANKPQNRHNLLYINNGNLTFTESAQAWGVNDPATTTQTTFFDYDHDGDLDLFMLNTCTEFRLVSALIPLDDVHKSQDLRKYMSYDKLYRNDGNHFTDVTQQAGLMSDFGFGLGVLAVDFNKDGWTDIFVANDFNSPEYFYENNGDGTFTESRNKYFRHTSYYSMGTDAGDFNRDGHLDLYTVDMAPEDYKRSKTTMDMVEPDAFFAMQRFGYNSQYMHNVLQVNNGNGTFSEISQFSGVNKSDWSWSTLFGDYDNDGYKDIFVTNGIKREVNDKDYQNKIRAKAQAEKRFLKFEDYKDMIPSQKLPNYMFRNNGDYTFTNVAESWGLDIESFSNGASIVDLDNDGDLDLVTNNIDAEAFVFENKANKNGNHYLRFKLEGSEYVNALNSKISLKDEHGEILHFDEYFTTRGYLSRSEDYVHFGLGTRGIIPEVEIVWPDSKVTKMTNVKADQLLVVNHSSAQMPSSQYIEAKPFADAASLLGTGFNHQENEYDDFKTQILLPHRMSQNGPALAVGDVNGDGLEDFYVGGAHEQAGAIFTQNADGTFSQKNIGALEKDRNHEDTGATFFDADGDGDLDLYVVSGGFEFPENDSKYQDRLYLNNGTGSFNLSVGKLPAITASGSCAVAHDFDNDGDLDLFVGGRVVHNKYPLPARSYLLRNDGGKFSDATQEIAPDAAEIGMVTSALWTDFNQDGQSDLMVVGEWTNIEFFENQGGKLVLATASYGTEETRGWWNHVSEADIDGDGDMDYLLGNLGLNYKFHASADKPFHVYCNDFDNDGVQDVVLAKKVKDDFKPIRGRTCSSTQMPFIKQKFTTFESYADADVTEIYGEENLNAALHYEAKLFESVWLKNNGGGQFEIMSLPSEAQFFPVNGAIFEDFNEDGKKDIFLAGNNYSAEVETSRADAGNGLLMLGDGSGGLQPLTVLQSGIFTPGDVKAIRLIKLANGNKAVLVANNNAPIQLFQSKAKNPS